MSATRDGAGIGRHKELELDEMLARVDYVAAKIELPAGYAPTARRQVAAPIVIADVLHDLEKKLAKIVNQLEARR
jgi:hypothetical protein